MTTLAQVQLNCPCCGERFDTEILGSTNILGRCTDFRPVTGGIPFIFHVVQSCPACGFTWDSNDFEEVKLSDEFRDRIKTCITPELDTEQLSPQRKHALLAMIYEIMEASPLQTAGAWLHAAWCAVCSNAKREERAYRKKAIRYLETALAEDAVPEEERAKLTYLVGELYRRTGDIKRAHVWFGKVKEATVDNRKQSWILNLAEQQKNGPRDELTDDIYENRRLKALLERARNFLKNSPELKESVKACGKHINYKAMIKGRRRVILFLVPHGYRFRIGLEKGYLKDENLWQGLLEALGATEDENITVIDNRARVTINVTDDAGIDALDRLLNTIRSQLLQRLEAFPD